MDDAYRRPIYCEICGNKNPEELNERNGSLASYHYCVDSVACLARERQDNV